MYGGKGKPVHLIILTFLMAVACMNVTAQAQSPEHPARDNDTYLWLEHVTGARALKWVHAQNAISTH